MYVCVDFCQVYLVVCDKSCILKHHCFLYQAVLWKRSVYHSIWFAMALKTVAKRWMKVYVVSISRTSFVIPACIIVIPH